MWESVKGGWKSLEGGWGECESLKVSGGRQWCLDCEWKVGGHKYQVNGGVWKVVGDGLKWVEVGESEQRCLEDG